MIRLKMHQPFFIAVVVSSSVGAQTLPPNETDLRASYCVAINQRMIDLNQKALSQEAGKKAADSAKKAALELYRVNLRKLQQYLMPRLQYVDALAIGTAHTSGVEDLDRILQSTASCQAKEPFPECMNRALPDLKVTKAKMAACSELSWLPN